MLLVVHPEHGWQNGGREVGGSWDSEGQSPEQLQVSILLVGAGQQQQVWQLQGRARGCHPHRDLVGDFSKPGHLGSEVRGTMGGEQNSTGI